MKLRLLNAELKVSAIVKLLSFLLFLLLLWLWDWNIKFLKIYFGRKLIAVSATFSIAKQ